MALLQRLISVYSGTGSRTIVLIDSDDWSGMCAPEGLSRGHNNVGKALMQVRELLSMAPPAASAASAAAPDS